MMTTALADVLAALDSGAVTVNDAHAAEIALRDAANMKAPGAPVAMFTQTADTIAAALAVKAKPATPAATRGPKMTAVDAKRFTHTSVHNAVTAEESVNDRFGCDCEAYKDIFTFKRWIAQGFVVRRGQKATHVPVIQPRVVPDADAPNGKREVKTSRMVPVFCRCQVDALKKS
jgi:hypothetical protein